MGRCERQVVVVLGLLGGLLPPAPLSLGPGVGGAAPEEHGLARGGGGGKKKKNRGLLIATEIEGTEVFFFQEDAKELLENIVVSIGVAVFKCGRGKGKGKGNRTHLFNVFTYLCLFFSRFLL